MERVENEASLIEEENETKEMEGRDNTCYRLLRSLSFGKYVTKLYFGGEKRQGEYSSVGGGITSLVVYLIIALISIIFLVQTFSRTDYTFKETYKPLLETNLPTTLILK